MFKVLVVDWADNTNIVEFNYDIVKAMGYAKEMSILGNTDYTLLLQDNLPRMKYQDGEEVSA